MDVQQSGTSVTGFSEIVGGVVFQLRVDFVPHSKLKENMKLFYYYFLYRWKKLKRCAFL